MRWIAPVLALATMFAAVLATFTRPIERFSLRDISIPPQFYAQNAYAINYDRVEMNEKFFINTLNTLKTNVSVADDGEEITVYSPLLLPMIDNFLLIALSNGFGIRYSKILNVKKTTDRNVRVTSEHLVHRAGKIYGASLELITVVSSTGVIQLVDFRLLGFVFEDRLHILAPETTKFYDLLSLS